MAPPSIDAELSKKRLFWTLAPPLKAAAKPPP
jgi:hypothetical protein